MIVQINDARGEKTDFDNKKFDCLMDKLKGNLLLDEKDTVTITVKPYGISYKTEILIHKKDGLMRSETVHDDFLSGVEISILKMKDTLRKLKKNHDDSINGDDSVDGEKLNQELRIKTIKLVEENVSEAITNMELLGHDFHIFRDSKKSCVSIVYKRNDGRYGYIETE